jgi:hypothetical protein
MFKRFGKFNACLSADRSSKGSARLDKLDKLDKLDENALPSPFGGRVGDGGSKQQSTNMILPKTSSHTPAS